jgi:hypothetical protein
MILDLHGQQGTFTLIVTTRNLKEKLRIAGPFRLVNGDSDMEGGGGGSTAAGEDY